MPGTTLAAIRQRMLRDGALRARLRTDLERTLAEEGVKLTPGELEEMRLSVMLADALQSPDPRRRPALPIDFTTARKAALGGQRPAASSPAPGSPPREPVNLAEWRARRAGR